MKIVVLQPPSPPGLNVKRDYAGGMGVADPSPRAIHGHDPGYITLPYMSLLYTAAVLEEAGHAVAFIDAQADNLDIPATIARVRENGDAARAAAGTSGKEESAGSRGDARRARRETSLEGGGPHPSPCPPSCRGGRRALPGGEGGETGSPSRSVHGACPEIVVVSVLNLPSLYGDLEVLSAIKLAMPEVRTVAVGTVCIPLFDEIAASGAVDAVIRGDPEAVILDLLEALSRERPDAGGAACASEPGSFAQTRGVLTNSQPARVTDLDALPRLPYHMVPTEKYRYHGFGKDTRFAAVFASRGCSFKCYYCPYPMGFGDCIVHRDPVKVVDEIEELQRQHGVGGILFRDQVFSMDWEKTRRLCDEILRRRLRLQWVVETRLDRVDADLLRRMKAAGCVRIHYGLESGDPKLFSRVGKDGAEGRMETLIRNFVATEKAGIHPHMFILIGLLGEDRDTIGRTIEVIRRIRPLTVQVAIVTPYPGTALFDAIKQKGLLLTEDWSQYTGFRPVARTEALSAEDLESARRLILREHRKAIAWKRRRQLAGLALRYARDGTLGRRLVRNLTRSRR